MAKISDLEKLIESRIPRLPTVSIPKIPLFPTPHFPKIPVLPPNPLVTNIENNYASEFYDRLSKWVADFDASLDEAHEVGVRLVSFGQSVVFHLENMGYWNPSLISFKGFTEEGDPVELIQHVSQISILLTKLPRPNPSEPKRPIGFGALHHSDEVQDGPQSENS